MEISSNILLLALLCGGGFLLLVAVGVVITLQNRQADLETGAPANSQDFAKLQPIGFTPANSPDLTRRAEAMLKNGDKAGAIKLYQESAGLGLREASDAVEKIEKQIYRDQFVRADPRLRSQVESLLKKGRKGDAVRLYAAANKMGMNEARQAVEAIDKALKNP